MNAEWMLGIAVVIIGCLITALVYFYQRDQKRNDESIAAMSGKIDQIWDTVTALNAQREGQLSFAKTLMDCQAESAFARKEFEQIRDCFDRLYKYIRDYIEERIKRHETNDHPEIS